MDQVESLQDAVTFKVFGIPLTVEGLVTFSGQGFLGAMVGLLFPLLLFEEGSL